MRELAIAVPLGLSLLLALGSGGTERIGRLLLTPGFPSAAAALINNPDWRGVALYSAGRWSEAADAFRAGHATAVAYDLGNALARAGRYADAIAAYDEALTRQPDDEDAQTNRQLVAMLLDAEKAGTAGHASGSADAVATERRDKPGGTSSSVVRSRGPEGVAGSREADSEAGAAAGGAVARQGTAGGANSDAPRSQRGGSGTNQGGLGSGNGRGETLLEDPFRMGRPVEARSIQADAHWLKTLPDDPGRFLKLRLAAEHNRRVEAGTAPPITGDPW